MSDTGSKMLDELRLQAWLAKAEIKNPSLHNDVSALAQMRDELRLQAHLGKLEAAEELDRIDGNWRSLKAKVDDVSGIVEADVRKLLGDIKEGYKRIRGA